MRRPWQIWLAYCVSLTLAVIALGWLSHQVLKLDEAEAMAQARAELEERVSAALWRLDVELTQLLAVEAGRPVSAFHPVRQLGGKASNNPSPLLMQPSDLVLLHFEVDEQGTWISPQCPDPIDYEFALGNGANRDNILVSQDRLLQLSASLTPKDLLAQLPEESITDLPQQLAANFALNDAEQVLVGNNANMPAQIQSPSQQSGSPSPFPQQFEQLAQSPQIKGRSSLDEYNRRFNTLQTATQQSLLQQRDVFLATPGAMSLSRSMPIWSGQRLLLVRRVVAGPRQLVQGCWLHWSAIRERLLAELSDLLPDANLARVEGPVPFNRLLATLPVQLIVPEAKLPLRGLSPMQLAVLGSWACFAAAAAAIGVLLYGVIQLSERRASFVSAVTHELRTPLTTFCMYSEMLAEGMVNPQQQQGYLETLRGEAERLSHLVENVLQYARLERSRSGWDISTLPVDSLLETVADRLQTRASQSGLTLRWSTDPATSGRNVTTNVAAVEQVLFNLVDNACKYARPSDPSQLDISLHLEGSWACIAVRDYGPGVPAAERRRMFQPFSRTAEVGPAPGVGLGLALCRRLASQLRGRLSFQAREPGAEFTLRVPLAD